MNASKTDLEPMASLEIRKGADAQLDVDRHGRVTGQFHPFADERAEAFQ